MFEVRNEELYSVDGMKMPVKMRLKELTEQEAASLLDSATVLTVDNMSIVDHCLSTAVVVEQEGRLYGEIFREVFNLGLLFRDVKDYASKHEGGYATLAKLELCLTICRGLGHHLPHYEFEKVENKYYLVFTEYLFNEDECWDPDYEDWIFYSEETDSVWFKTEFEVSEEELEGLEKFLQEAGPWLSERVIKEYAYGVFNRDSRSDNEKYSFEY